jgi:hypothetical protein
LLEWKWIEWNIGETWKRHIVQKLNDVDITTDTLKRSVYVIRANGSFAIEYKKNISPTLYIGEGNFKDRITQHKNWLRDFAGLVNQFPFLIAIATPRVQKFPDAYRDLEAALLIEFSKSFGSAPLMNKQLEKRLRDYIYDGLRTPLTIGQGAKRFLWAIKPLKCCSFYKAYNSAANGGE